MLLKAGQRRILRRAKDDLLKTAITCQCGVKTAVGYVLTERLIGERQANFGGMNRQAHATSNSVTTSLRGLTAVTSDNGTMSKSKQALITGITGQDGSYLAELLLEKGYAVHGIKRRASSFNTTRIDHLYQDPHELDPRLTLHYGDLSDGSNLQRIIEQVQPDEIYNLGAQSHVAVSLRHRNTPPTLTP